MCAAIHMHNTPEFSTRAKKRNLDSLFVRILFSFKSFVNWKTRSSFIEWDRDVCGCEYLSTARILCITLFAFRLFICSVLRSISRCMGSGVCVCLSVSKHIISDVCTLRSHCVFQFEMRMSFTHWLSSVSIWLLLLLFFILARIFPWNSLISFVPKWMGMSLKCERVRRYHAKQEGISQQFTCSCTQYSLCVFSSVSLSLSLFVFNSMNINFRWFLFHSRSSVSRFPCISSKHTFAVYFSFSFESITKWNGDEQKTRTEEEEKNEREKLPQSVRPLFNCLGAMRDGDELRSDSHKGSMLQKRLNVYLFISFSLFLFIVPRVLWLVNAANVLCVVDVFCIQSISSNESVVVHCTARAVRHIQQ